MATYDALPADQGEGYGEGNEPERDDDGTPGEDEALAMLSSLAKHMLWLIPLGIFLSWITQFAVPLASLKRVSGGEAIALALRAIGANIPALIINFLCLMAVVILTGIVLMIPITLVSAAFAGSSAVGSLDVIPTVWFVLTMFQSASTDRTVTL